jgi:hypothetical protein
VAPLIASPSQVFNQPIRLSFDFASLKGKSWRPKIEPRFATWALYLLKAGVLDSAYGFYFHVRCRSNKSHCFHVRVKSFETRGRRKGRPHRGIGALRWAAFAYPAASELSVGFARSAMRCLPDLPNEVYRLRRSSFLTCGITSV